MDCRYRAHVRQNRFVLDGEAVVLGVDGVADFNALHSRKHEHEVQFCAFDVLVEGDKTLENSRSRCAKHDRLLARRPEGVFVNPFERGELGPVLFRAACKMVLEGLVSPTFCKQPALPSCADLVAPTS